MQAGRTGRGRAVADRMPVLLRKEDPMTLCRTFARSLSNRTLALGLGLFLAFAALAAAQPWKPSTSQPSFNPHVFPARGSMLRPVLKAGFNLTYHGGPVIPSAHVVFLFWGPSFNNVASPDYAYARTLQSFRDQFGTTPEYNTITQYSGSNGTIALSNLAAGTADWFDTTTPPAVVTQAIAEGEVGAYLSTHTFDNSAIYEVVLPTSSYATLPGEGVSCGGAPPIGFCAYHYFFNSGANVAKYSVQPYPSCGSCGTGSWSDVQNQEHFVTHETREAVTDPLINAWTDANGYEADDKCAWSPTPFFGSGGYGYQYEWSNALNDCAASTPISLPPNYIGTLDAANCTTLAGWGADRNRLNTPINVSFYKDGALLTTVLANLSRPDVGAYLGDNGLHGFSFATPSGLLDGNSHSLSARLEGSSTNLAGSPISLTCGSGTIAAPSGLTASYSPATHQVTLHWTDNSNNEQGFVAQFSYSGSTFSDITDPIGANATTLTTSGTAPAGSYQFRIRAYNGSLNSAYSNVASLVVYAPTTSIAWIQTAESTWGPAGTLTAAGYAANGSGGVTLVWRERSSAGVWGSWNTDAYAAVPAADTTWSNTISSGNPTDKCHWFDAYTVYSGVTSATFHYTGAPGCP
jgi:hypothetical protein